MSDQPASPPPPTRRRSSIVEMFSSRGGSNNVTSSSPPSGVAASSNAPQHRRGASISAIGLNNASPGQNSPYDAFARQRRASFAASSGSGSPEFRNSFGDDPAVIEDDEPAKSPTANASPSLARRVSFGAQALRDVRQGSGPGSPGAGRRPSKSLFTLNENNENNDPQRRVPSGTAKTGGEGFNWSEALRDRTKRSPSFSASANPFAANSKAAARAPSSTAPEPPKEMPKPAEPVPVKMRKPDHLGERMLRGDFMMD